MREPRSQDPFLIAVSETIHRRNLLRAKDSILIAVSGGPDSIALLAALTALNDGRWKLAVGHVNHELRGRESDADQRFVERIAASLGCPVYVARGPIANHRNVEERARERRYRLLAEIARRKRLRVIATAHTRDDQAETVLHRLLRGTGTAGLAGIRPRRDDGVVRPLLDVSREEVLKFLRRRGLAHRTDRSNAEHRFTRNRIRRELLPLLERRFHPRIKQALARLADIAREDDELLERLAARRHARLEKGGALDCVALARLAPALQRRVIRRWLGASRGDLRGIDLHHVERVRDIATAAAGGKSVAVPGGSVHHHAEALWWHPGPTRRSKPYARALAIGKSIEIADWMLHAYRTRRAPRPGPLCAVFDARDLRATRITARSTRPGDRLNPLGLRGSKKLQDVFVDAKVPRQDRGVWPVIEIEGTIVWVPGLVRADAAPIRAATRSFLVIEATRVAAEFPMCYGPNGRTFEPSFAKRRALAGARLDGAAARQSAEPPGGT